MSESSNIVGGGIPPVELGQVYKVTVIGEFIDRAWSIRLAKGRTPNVLLGQYSYDGMIRAFEDYKAAATLHKTRHYVED